MPRGLAHKTTALIEASSAILAEIQPATIRAVCYRLFTRGVIPDMSVKSTKKVSGHLKTAREQRMIPWGWIVDETRQIRGWEGWSNPDAFVREQLNGYRRDWWQDQPQ